MSTITKLLKEYSQIRISYEAIRKDASIEVAKVLNQLATELVKNGWKCPPSEVPTDAIAMSAFFEMFTLRIGPDAPIMLCYYYSSRVANNKSFPTNVRALENKFRAFIVFKAMVTYKGKDWNAYDHEYRDTISQIQQINATALSV